MSNPLGSVIGITCPVPMRVNAAGKIGTCGDVEMTMSAQKHLTAKQLCNINAKYGKSSIGLTHIDGITMNGDEEYFFIKQKEWWSLKTTQKPGDPVLMGADN